MTRDISLYVSDIIENMNKAESFTEGVSYAAFMSDEKTRYAVVRCIEIIGEVSKNIPLGLRQKYDEIPWKEMTGMGDKIARVYFGIVYEDVWQVVKNDIPVLKPLIIKILDDMRNTGLT